MPTVTITLIDTPTGGVAIKTDFTPAVGQRCSAAQSAALDIINRTRHAFGLQTRLSSLIEAVINVVIGFVISLAITAVVLPAYGHQVTWSENLQITLIFTFTSILRSYFVRRYFNARIHAAALRMADQAHQFE